MAFLFGPVFNPGSLRHLSFYTHLAPGSVSFSGSGILMIQEVREVNEGVLDPQDPLYIPPCRILKQTDTVISGPLCQSGTGIRPVCC